MVLGIGLAVPYSGSAVRASPDGLFYEAQKREVLGVSRADALNEVFDGPQAAALKRSERDLPLDLRRVDNPEWRDYSDQFYRRRWTVPVLAAALDPIFGDQSLELPSLFGWMILAPLLYVFLRCRFERAPSFAASALCVVLPPFFEHGPGAGTDVLGLSLVVAALIALWRFRVAGSAWLAVWIATALVLSFTRDATIVLISAALWLAVAERSRRMLVATAAAALASLPAPLLFAAPLRENFAYVFNDFRVPIDTDWGSILGQYPDQAVEVLRSDLRYPIENGLPPLSILLGLLVITGLVALYGFSARRDPFLGLARGSGAGALIIVAISINYTAMRLELVFVPAIAVGLALLGERTLSFAASRSRPSAVT